LLQGSWASRKLNYFGFSYGAFPWRRLRDLFQNRYRAMVLMRQFMALLDSERMTR
jgi:hypothetical protein